MLFVLHILLTVLLYLDTNYKSLIISLYPFFWSFLYISCYPFEIG